MTRVEGMHHDPATDAQRADRLRASGMRVTAGRVAALAHLESHPHSRASEVHAALAQASPSVSLQSVHNIMNDLTEHGLLRRVDLPDSDGALYEIEHLDNHHHVQCVVCRRIEDVECATGLAPCLTPAGPAGGEGGSRMRILEASVTFRGICADCEQAA